MRLWASRQFGPAHAAEIADILSRYTMYNGRRKPELLGPATYSCVNYGEAESVVADFKSIAARAEKLYGTLPEDRKDAFYELVLFPTKASALVNELYYAAGRNALYAAQGRSTANEMADLTRALFSSDTALMGSFNHSLARGKWNHFMDQPHLGYTGWQDPPANTLGAVNLRELSLPEASSMGVAVEGSEAAWPGPAADPALPVFDPFTTRARSIEVFNKGKASFRFTALSDKPWIKISPSSGEVRGQVRIRVEVLWNKVSAGDAAGSVTITGAGVTIPVRVQASLPPGITPGSLDGFMESEGCVSMEAEHYTGRTAFGPNRWIRIEGYGHTLSAMRATSGAGAPEAVPGRDAPCLEYRMYLTDTGHVDVEGIFAPTLNFMPGRGLSYAVSLGDDPPQVVVLVPKDYNARNGNRDWEKSVEDNARHCHTSHHVAKTGYHTLRIWMVDPGVVLQKIVVDCGGVRPSYLGPPESFRRIAKSR